MYLIRENDVILSKQTTNDVVKCHKKGGALRPGLSSSDFVAGDNLHEISNLFSGKFKTKFVDC